MWTHVAIQWNRKSQNSASTQGKPTLTACTGMIKVINPVLTSKGKLPKAADNKFVQGTVKDLGFQIHQAQDREGLSRTTRPGRGNLGHGGGWQDIEENHTHSAIHIPIKQKPQTRGLEGYGSSCSAPLTPQRPYSIEHGQQEAQPGIPLGKTWRKFPEDLSQRDRLQRPYVNHQRLESHQEVQTPGGEGKQDKGESNHYPSYRKTTDPDREYSDSFKITRSRPKQLYSGFTPFGNQQIRAKSHHSSQSQEVSRKRQGYMGKKKLPSTKGRESQRISIPTDRNITPTKIEHNVVTPESSLKNDALWLQMSQYAEETQKEFAEIEASHERMKKLTASVDKIVKTLQEGHAQ
ncbi:hypothetical protein O181_075727 [Austropuccinia psidii MF-1]|uniref:Uncharacterized protein n=1 Tax=Austropuccinia psidii MF-1 TaxID=1389203 RepID=A0A9Q3FFJ3_9BASI|nr:hypothetical protein [Austropuccinia psidii MF-1]